MIMSIFVEDAIKFAIHKEQEAADFYTELASRVGRPEIKDELLSFAKVELGHKRRLENIDLENINFKPSKQDLKIVDYMVETEPTDNMSYEDVLKIAMERELSSMRLYADLAHLINEPDVKALFLKLSEEEGNHKNYFESIWDEKVLFEN
jgi:rubrerythrin